MTTPAYDQLRAHARETGVLNAVEALLGWDQETYMPSAGAASRAEQSSALAGIIHERRLQGLRAVAGEDDGPDAAEGRVLRRARGGGAV